MMMSGTPILKTISKINFGHIALLQNKVSSDFSENGLGVVLILFSQLYHIFLPAYHICWARVQSVGSQSPSSATNRPAPISLYLSFIRYCLDFMKALRIGGIHEEENCPLIPCNQHYLHPLLQGTVSTTIGRTTVHPPPTRELLVLLYRMPWMWHHHM